MVRQTFDLLGYPLPRERFNSLDDPGMQHPPPLLEQPPIGHFMREGVLEGVGLVGEEARLVQELGGLEVRQAVVKRHLREFGNGLEHGHGDLGANHGSGLQQALFFRW
jgi:hypothetical protein